MTARKMLIAVAAVLLVAMIVPVAFADTTPAPATSTYPGALTKEQVEQVKPILDKMLELRKELLQKYVDMGKITKEDADARIQWMEQNHNARIESGYVPGLGMGRGRGARGFGGGFGCGGYGCGGAGCGYYGNPPAAPAPTTNQL
ncbi:YckD family protein [Thermincola potens]|uniref:DUF2680 domain-containing protein n=1 Tax=Thermincola potens (strain JR) TaxID=635013 RepID=D5XEL2_THEPJ|nr:YckD family protein [Thermincola potens]ADG82083.1 conserved hypothetical protein [Thermincola potens JR]